MLFSTDIIDCVAAFLRRHGQSIPIVLDPVMVAKSGDPLLKEDAIFALKEKLIPLATLITPNLPEAHALAPGSFEKSRLAQELLKLGCYGVLLKGGHEEGETSEDVFLDQSGQSTVLSTQRILSNNTHGTGCTLSAAITSFLARKIPLPEACKQAKQYLRTSRDGEKPSEAELYEVKHLSVESLGSEARQDG